MATSIAQYLDLTPAQARSQWSRIKSRVPKRRQEPYLPVEVVLCFGLFFVLNPHRFGGANIGSAPSAVHDLAKTFCRSAGSLTSKMLNLDGSRTNCARVEPELFARLSTSHECFLRLYRLVLEAARSVGLLKEQVPDFLQVLCAQDHVHILLGQDELGSGEIEVVLEEKHTFIQERTEHWKFTRQQTEHLVIQKARLGQHRFARAGLKSFVHTCAFCGLAPGDELLRNRLLVASHIKPWRASTEQERLDVRNGVAACPVHDAAFDQGLLTVNGGLKIHRAGALTRSMSDAPMARHYFGEAVVLERLRDARQEPAAKYLAYHKAHIFKGAA